MLTGETSTTTTTITIIIIIGTTSNKSWAGSGRQRSPTTRLDWIGLDWDMGVASSSSFPSRPQAPCMRLLTN